VRNEPITSNVGVLGQTKMP